MSSHDSSINPPDDSDRFDGLMPKPLPSRLPELPPDERLLEVDQIAVRKLGGFNFLLPEQWSALSREDRMRLIKAGAVTFLSQGEEVPLREALESLRAATEGRTADTRSPNRLPGSDQVNFDVGTPRPREA